jgi:large subunit ribosomal protein L20
MAKVKWAVVSHRRRKRVLKRTKGYRGDRGRRLRTAKETLRRAMAYRTRDRKMRKREFRRLWIIRLNAATRAHGLTYGQFMAACKKAKVQLDRKQLAELAIQDQGAFEQLVAQVTAR